LCDLGLVSTKEPFAKLRSIGLVLAGDGVKMSKSKGNVINPDDIVKNYGADTLRVYELFMGPFDHAITWNEQGVKGVKRFLNRVWNLTIDCQNNNSSSKEALKTAHQLNKKISSDIEQMKFNTAVAAFMEFINFAEGHKAEICKDSLERFIVLLSPFAPHICEELWEKLGHKQSITQEQWPIFDAELTKEEKIFLVVQVNGKVRAKIEAIAGIDQSEVETLAKTSPIVQKWLDSKPIKKIIYIPGRLVNIVV
jgi:leucyl-tRNA synthetase